MLFTPPLLFTCAWSYAAMPGAPQEEQRRKAGLPFHERASSNLVRAQHSAERGWDPASELALRSGDRGAHGDWKRVPDSSTVCLARAWRGRGVGGLGGSRLLVGGIVTPTPPAAGVLGANASIYRRKSEERGPAVGTLRPAWSPRGRSWHPLGLGPRHGPRSPKPSLQLSFQMKASGKHLGDVAARKPSHP